jgi:single-strand DNA-binding protein
MNKVLLVGRFTKDPDIKYTNSGMTIASFTIAVDRKFKKEGSPTADFINCKAFSKTAEFVEKYFKKGMRIGIEGQIQTGSYQKEDGTKVYTTEVVCDGVEFVESKSAGSNDQREKPEGAVQSDDFMNIPDNIAEELPFN